MRAVIPKQKLIVIVGPTASGKSALAVRLAKKFNGEIISADSRQVYRELDVGTGKVEGKWVASRLVPLKAGLARRINKNIVRAKSRTYLYLYKGIPHHCIDFVSPKKTFTVAEYKKCAAAAIEDTASRGKIPILAGGTGFWIDAVVYDIDLPAVPPNPKLRKRLEKKNPAELLKILRKLDPQRARTVEQKNPRRLIRAIEIARALGRVPKLARRKPYRTFWIGLRPSKSVLDQRIKQRARTMIRCGLVQETKKLLRLGVSQKRIHEFGFEYRTVLKFLQKRISRSQLVGRLQAETLSYARRQETWFKRNRDIRWVHTTQEAEKLVKKFVVFPPKRLAPEI